jgi:hypothetical protein
MTDELIGSPARRMTWFAGGVVVLASVAIWVFATQQESGLQPPEMVRAHIATTILLAIPGLIGWIGALTGRRTVVVAAGILCMLQSVIAFSGVTLVYLVPAIAFLRSGTDGIGASDRIPIRPWRIVLAFVISIPVAFVLVPRLGILVVVPVALVAGLAGTRRAVRPPHRPRGLEAARGAAIVLFVIGAWAANLALTEEACWVGHSTTSGDLSWERVPPTDVLTVGPREVGETCTSAAPTSIGIGLGGVLLIASIAAAGLPRSRGQRQVSGD